MKAAKTDDSVSGSPTKSFFMTMLTRDIELNDAILDLLDNCIDGVVRSKGKESSKEAMYYNGYEAKIEITSKQFKISDNCGGIPINVARNYAFRMGRSMEAANDELPTVGIYGIGMKRAIFKIGKSAVVKTRNGSDHYQVTIPKSWADSNEWDFPLSNLDEDDCPEKEGTEICISDLNNDIRAQWENKENLESFVENLRTYITKSYSFICKKGFKITVNDRGIRPLGVKFLSDSDYKQSKASLQPYIYKDKIDSVKIDVIVGLYSHPLDPDQIDDVNLSLRTTAEAGWTVVCNDRVILYNDKSYLTGWGEAGVPQYHTQFVGIRGIVRFESDDPEKLPMTTTKRGIDMSSNLYLAVKNKMREGLKLFTDYTNHWKGKNAEERQFSAGARPVDSSLFLDDGGQRGTSMVSLKLKKVGNKGNVFKPNLPKPKNNSTQKVIRFFKDINEINKIKQYIYDSDSPEIHPSQVGEACFDMVLSQLDKDGLQI